MNQDKSIQDILIDNCVTILNREDFKYELKKIITPLIEMIMIQIYPYIYISMVLVILSFLLILGIFILLLKTSNKNITDIN
jgi:hypothetical protein